jgi:hypothetical protein
MCSDGLRIEGRVAADDSYVKLVVDAQSGQLPAKLFFVKPSGGKRHRITMDSKEIDSVLIVQDKDGKQLAWDDDSGGSLNSLRTLTAPKDDACKIYAASLNGAGRFTLKVQESHQ